MRAFCEIAHGAAGVRASSQQDLVEESFMNTASLIDINLCYILHRKRVGQKKREYSSSSVAGESWGSLSIKSAPCLLLAGRERRHAPRCGRSLNITSKTFPQRLTILLGLNACCVRRSRNALAGRHQIAPCWIFWMPKAPGLPAHRAGEGAMNDASPVRNIGSMSTPPKPKAKLAGFRRTNPIFGADDAHRCNSPQRLRRTAPASTRLCK